MIAHKTTTKTIFGDWQTPIELSRCISQMALNRVRPQAVLEPNCGEGSFIKAVIESGVSVQSIIGMDIDISHINKAKNNKHNNLEIIQSDFFTYDWRKKLENLPEPILIIGNPPWVTNSELSRLNSNNLPSKSNINSARGIDAITGKSNFDISEWMIIKEIEALQNKTGALAMLCKTATARKVLAYIWKNDCQYTKAEIRKIDAKKWFEVSIDACLLFIELNPSIKNSNKSCNVYSSLNDKTEEYVLGWRYNRAVPDIDTIDSCRKLISHKGNTFFVWRSGIKHDCRNILELRFDDDGKYINGLSEPVEIEKDLLFPAMKSSDLANDRYNMNRNFIVTQQKVGDDTRYIKFTLPETWSYLTKHQRYFDNRKSSIYKNKPPFSIFGIGNYTFKKWKVAIPGMYKRLCFKVVGPIGGKPVVFDDTCYFLSFDSEKQAQLIAEVLNSDISKKILSSFIFWDNKRPVTKDILSILNIDEIAKELGLQYQLEELFPNIKLEFSQGLFDDILHKV